MSKLLVTGGAGYVGSHVVQCLVQERRWQPEDIVVFDNFSQGHRELLPTNILCIEGDLKNKQDITEVFENYAISSVIHLAGVLNVAESMQEPALYFHTNVLGGLNLLEAMVAGGCCTIVFSSSCTVYGQASSPVSEKTVCEPISPYGESKLQFEQWLTWYSKIYHFKALSLRYFNAAGAAYGIGEAHVPEIHLIPSVLNAALNERNVFTIYGTDYDTFDGTCVRDYVHVSDLADAHIRALDFLLVGSPGMNIFNIGSGRGASVREIVSIAETVTSVRVPVRYASRRPGDAAAMVADTSKAVKELGWGPEHTIEDCIRDAWQWLQNRDRVLGASM